MHRANDEDGEKRLLNEFERNNTKTDVENSDEALDDVLDEDLFILDLSLDCKDGGRDVRIADVPVKLTRGEVLNGQQHEDICQTVLTRQSRKKNSAFY